MSEPQSVESIDRKPFTPTASETHLRAIGAPLSTGASRRSSASSGESNGNRIPSVPPGRALPGSTAPDASSGLTRAMGAFRAALPLVQRLLPLLDGNVVTAIANLFNPHAPSAPPPKVDLAPLENGLTELQTQQRNLCDQVTEQNASLKRVEDQLAMVREATDRNTLEQQELLEDLKTFRKKVKIGVAISAVLVIGLLAASLVLNVMLFLHLKSVLP
jgi:hypothetical protein